MGDERTIPLSFMYVYENSSKLASHLDVHRTTVITVSSVSAAANPSAGRLGGGKGSVVTSRRW